MNFKRTVFVALTTAATLGLFATPALAKVKTEPQITTISGTIYNASNIPVNKADVTVDCNGKIKNTKTNASGVYSVTYDGKVCVVGTTVNVSASKSGVGDGSANGDVTAGGTANINFVMLSVTVPEFGEIAGALAFIGSLGAFFKLRKSV